MNFIAILCYCVLLPYFASLVFPSQEAITCNAGFVQNCFVGSQHKCMSKMENRLISQCLPKKTKEYSSSAVEESDEYDDSISSVENVEDKYFVQKLDHFHYIDSTKWRQRYLVYDRHYDGNGIVFIWIGTDDDITYWSMQTGRWNEYAKRANALCVGIVLRGYGKSLPNGNVMNENLKYLNSEQALADVAWFICNFRGLLQADHELPEKLKWVAYGKGRQGALAAWLRMKFPHLVHATLSLSAPVLAKEDFNEYFELIESDMLNKEQDFKNKIHEAYIEIKTLLESRKFKKLGKLFKFCKNKILENETKRKKNIDFMYFTFAQTVAIIMRYGNDILTAIKSKVTDIMLGVKDKYQNLHSIDRFALLVKLVLKIYNCECLDIGYNNAIKVYEQKIDYGYDITYEYLKLHPDTALHYPLQETFGERMALYQNCNEFGQFMTFKNMFGTAIDLRFYTDFCHAIFGERYYPIGRLEKGVRRTNVFYGGLNIVVSRVIFVYGSEDPYRKLGVTNRTPRNTVTHLLQGARHCYELDNYKSIDPQLKCDVKEDIYVQLMEWLQLSGNNKRDVEKKDSEHDENAEKTYTDGDIKETV